MGRFSEMAQRAREVRQINSKIEKEQDDIVIVDNREEESHNNVENESTYQSVSSDSIHEGKKYTEEQLLRIIKDCEYKHSEFHHHEPTMTTSLSTQDGLWKRLSNRYNIVVDKKVLQECRTYGDLVNLIMGKPVASNKSEEGQEFETALKYYFGNDGYEENNELAFKYFSTANKNGDVRADGFLGEMYLRGFYVQKNLYLAKLYLTSAVEKNEDLQFSAQLAEAYLEEGDNYAPVYYHFKSAANMGNVNGMFGLARCFYYGWGIAQNDDQAIIWFRKAIENGDDRSYVYLGLIYNSQNKIQLAIDMFQKSADAGYYWGMEQLGRVLYFEKEDYINAKKWLEKACEGDRAYAKFLIGYMYECGDGVLQNTQTANQYYREAMALGDIRSKLALQYNGFNRVPQSVLQQNDIV